MIKDILVELFERDIPKLKHEIEQYEDEEKLWVISNEIKNPAGNLALHITGNLKHYVGAVLGKSEYIRNRDAEFNDKNIPKSEILKSIDETLEIVKHVISQLSEEELKREYPEHVFGKGMTTAFFIVHLAAHLNYHLGQINYHRRILG
ncbi:MAG: DinB family protein [Ignavibacteriaceae bacterium]